MALRTWSVIGLLIVVLVGVRASPSLAKIDIPPRTFSFDIKPQTPLKDLLPAPPKTLTPPAPWIDDPALAPEISLGEPVSKKSKDAMEEIAHLYAKINHLNHRDPKIPDGFLEALLAHRGDLRGVPFLMGKECRSPADKAAKFAAVVRVIQREMDPSNFPTRFTIPERLPMPARASGPADAADVLPPSPPPTLSPREIVWRRLNSKLTWAELEPRIPPGTTADELDQALVAALVQMIAPDSPIYGPGLPWRLAKIRHADATRALAKLALFSPDKTVRQAAVEGLKGRPADESAGVLMGAFQYPLPAAAERSAEALVALGRNDVLAKLVDVLDQPDPRAPAERTGGAVVRELVRVNHLRNCALCHPPGNTPDTPGDVLQGSTPMPDRSASRSGGRYGFSESPDILVRIDMTYLRQDFSLVLPVKDAEPWPANQRFDFFVRTRDVTSDEAAECRRQLQEQVKTAGQPYHRAALTALRGLTGRDAGTSPEAWREMLKDGKN